MSTEDEKVIRHPSSKGLGSCMACGAPCLAGWSHFEPDEGMCDDCALATVNRMVEEDEAAARRKESE